WNEFASHYVRIEGQINLTFSGLHAIFKQVSAPCLCAPVSTEEMMLLGGVWFQRMGAGFHELEVVMG
ncbi:hypothetical protein ACJX0J_034037, partial [Zea mays]